MLIESFEHAQADFEARLLIDARNEAETVITATEKSLRRPDFARDRQRELLPGELQRIERRWQALKEAMGGSDRDAIQRADARAESRDAAPGRNDDEPQRARSARRQERERHLGRTVLPRTLDAVVESEQQNDD